MGLAINRAIKKNIILSVLYFMAFIMLITGVSYALFIKEDVNTNNQLINVGSIDASISNSTGVLSITNLTPKDEKELRPDENIYSFSITNTGDYTLQYEVYLVDNTDNFIKDCINSGGCPNFSEKALRKEYYRYINYKMENITGDFNDIYLVGKKNIGSGTILAGEAKTYTLQIWLSTLVPNDVIGKTSSFNIMLTATAVDSPIEVESDELTVGDIIKIGDQEFYYLSTYEDTIKMISKYNIRVGSDIMGSKILSINENDPLYNRQDPTSTGSYISNGFSYLQKSVIKYTNEEHCVNQGVSSSTPCYTKYQGSILEEKIKAYADYLRKDLGALVVGDAPTMEDINLLNEIPDYYMTSFWTKTGVDSSNRNVYHDTNTTDLSTDELVSYSGVRPVLLVNKKNIKKKVYLESKNVLADLSTLENNKLKTGSVITIGNEIFYVISVNNGVIRMLAKENLNCSHINPSADEIIEQDTTDDSFINFAKSSNHEQGKCLNSLGEESYCYSTYKKSDIESYNNLYKETLYKRYSVSVRVDLPNQEDLLKMGYSTVTNTFEIPDYSWAYSTNYWTKIPVGSDHLITVKNNNSTVDELYNYKEGLRPVLIIHQSQISNLP